MRIVAATSLGVLLISTAALAQDEVARRQAIEIATRVPLEKAMTGAPYSADTLVEGVQTLADGNRIVRKTTGRVYRDTEGRTRREEDAVAATGKNPATGTLSTVLRTNISIVDPVSGFSYSLDPERKIAWRTSIGAGTAIMGQLEAMKVERAREAGGGDKVTAEARTVEEKKLAEKMAAAGARGGGGEVRMRTPNGDVAFAYAPNPGPLERKTLEGVTVEGRKTTATIPAGQVGNEQPLTIVSEEWRSTDLNVLVMTHHSDPRTGESSYRLINIIRAEPDRSLFMVPSDYEIRESGVRRNQ